MTEQGRKDIETVYEAVRDGDLSGDLKEAVSRIVRGYKSCSGRLECVRGVVEKSLPRLDEAFRRYGCGPDACGTDKCSRSYPCQASAIRVVANDLRDCIGSANCDGDKFEKFDTVFWEDPDEGISSGDYTVVGVDGEILTLEADDGSEVEAYASECTHRDWRDENFPNWALCYFVNGDGSSLTDEEMRQVDDFVSRMRDNGYTLDTVTDDTNEFCAHPAFGLGSDTTRVRFYKPMKGPTDA